MTARGIISAYLLVLLLAASPASAQPVVHTLSGGATLTTDAADEVVIDRETLDEISIASQGSTDPTLEAYWATPELEIFLNHEPVGFVKMDDWDDLDVDALWESYMEGAQAQSSQMGVQIQPLRWIVEPTLDEATATAYYALEVQFGSGEPIVNMIILDFGRRGYEEMTVVQTSSAFQSIDAATVARRIASAYAFGPDADYSDFRAGDTVAAVGAGGLVAATLGAKFGKGILAIALVFLKKFWFVLLLIPAAIWRSVSGRGGSAQA